MINWCSGHEEDVIAVARGGCRRLNNTNLKFRKAKGLEEFTARCKVIGRRLLF
jgi:hypothetical protein